MESLHARMNSTATAFHLSSDFQASTFSPKSSSSGGLIKDPTYLRLWEFEKRTDQDAWAEWHKENWQLAVLSSAIYLVTIFGIKGYMRERAPFRIRTLLFFWNAILALFSIIGFFRSAPELEFVLRKSGGIHDSICRR